MGLSVAQVEEMYRYLAIANYEDRFVVPTAHREEALKYAQAEANGCGFSFGNGCGDGKWVNMFGGKKIQSQGRYRLRPDLGGVWHTENYQPSAGLSPGRNCTLTGRIWRWRLVSQEVSPQMRCACWTALTQLGGAIELMDAQENYGLLFDQGARYRCTCLNMCTGNRAISQAMVDLIDIYRKNGFELDALELPTIAAV